MFKSQGFRKSQLAGDTKRKAPRPTSNAPAACCNRHRRGVNVAMGSRTTAALCVMGSPLYTNLPLRRLLPAGPWVFSPERTVGSSALFGNCSTHRCFVGCTRGRNIFTLLYHQSSSLVGHKIFRRLFRLRQKDRETERQRRRVAALMARPCIQTSLSGGFPPQDPGLSSFLFSQITSNMFRQRDRDRDRSGFAAHPERGWRGSVLHLGKQIA